MLTQSKLKELFHYCPSTGLFTRLVNVGKSKAGDIAGSRDNRGYLCVGINGKPYQSHRLAFLYMTGKFNQHHTDHINGVTDDNRWANLRPVTRSENNKNKKMPSNNTSGHIGVSWHKSSGKWRAQYVLNNKNHHLGCFSDINDAIAARETVSHLFHENHGRILQKLN
jgi:hypothetical protein